MVRFSGTSPPLTAVTFIGVRATARMPPARRAWTDGLHACPIRHMPLPQQATHLTFPGFAQTAAVETSPLRGRGVWRRYEQFVHTRAPSLPAFERGANPLTSGRGSAALLRRIDAITRCVACSRAMSVPTAGTKLSCRPWKSSGLRYSACIPISTDPRRPPPSHARAIRPAMPSVYAALRVRRCVRIAPRWRVEGT